MIDNYINQDLILAKIIITIKIQNIQKNSIQIININIIIIHIKEIILINIIINIIIKIILQTVTTKK